MTISIRSYKQILIFEIGDVELFVEKINYLNRLTKQPFFGDSRVGRYFLEQFDVCET